MPLPLRTGKSSGESDGEWRTGGDHSPDHSPNHSPDHSLRPGGPEGLDHQKSPAIQSSHNIQSPHNIHTKPATPNLTPCCIPDRQHQVLPVPHVPAAPPLSARPAHDKASIRGGAASLGGEQAAASCIVEGTGAWTGGGHCRGRGMARGAAGGEVATVQWVL